MTPFDLKLSKVIYDERIQEAANPCHFNNTGIWSVRPIPDFSTAWHTLAQKLGVQAQSNPTTSTSHIS